MLTKLYIDNFRCFSKFSLEFRSINLLLGVNGTGKTSVFDVLRKLQNFVVQGEKVTEVFFASDNPRWTAAQNGSLEAKNQAFGLEFEEQGHLYKYTLRIGFGKNGARVELEHLVVDDEVLIKFENEILLLTQSTTMAEPFPLASNRSAVGSLPETPELKKISSFRRIMQRMMVIQVMPPTMEAHSSGANNLLSSDTSNLISWYRFLMEDQDRINEINDTLKEMFDGFSHFELRTVPLESSTNNVKTLLMHFEAQNQDQQTTAYTLAELSDGERALIALYVIMIYAKHEHILLCLDEPENFLALTEIQPWVIELYDHCDDGLMQAILISHHPEIINYLAADAGIWFERSQNGFVVTQPVIDEADTGLAVAELIARGWMGA